MTDSIPSIDDYGYVADVTTRWTGWPDASNPYAANQPTRWGMLDVVLHLTPAS